MDDITAETETSMSSNEGKFEVFFDGECPLCKREIDMIRRKDKHDRLQLTDIAAADFQPTDRSLDTLMRQIHGRYPNGQYVTGVDVFREIYSRIGWESLVKPTKWFGVRHGLNWMYRFFAYWRYRHAMHRMGKLGRPVDGDCDTCQIPTKQEAS